MITFIRDPAVAATLETFIPKNCRHASCGTFTESGTFAVVARDAEDRALLKSKFPEIAWNF